MSETKKKKKPSSKARSKNPNLEKALNKTPKTASKRKISVAMPEKKEKVTVVVPSCPTGMR